MKQGKGAVADPEGRHFYLWQDEDLREVFQSQNLPVIDFFRQPLGFVSKAGITANG